MDRFAKQAAIRETLPNSFWRNARGSTIVPFAVAIPTLLGIVGIATDYGILEMKRSRLQVAADQAAISAAQELTLANASESAIIQVADASARSMVDLSSSTLTVETTVDTDVGRVDVILREEWTPFFAHFIKQDVTPVTVNATAQLAGKMNLCILTLDPSGAKAFHMDKNAKVQANNCAVYSNSTNSEGIRLDSNAQIDSSMVCSAGGVKAKSGVINPKPTTDCVAIDDPLADRLPPKSSGCDVSNLDISSGVHTLDPKTYCGGLKISGNARVTFTEGDYVIQDGKFEISGDAQVTGKNTAFYLKGESTTLQFTENTTLAFTGAATGSMAGLLFFEDRSVSKGRKHRINSIRADVLTGTIYMSRGTLLVDPTTPVAQDSAYTAIIAYNVELNEGPTLVLNDDYGNSNVPVPEGIRFGTQVVLAN